MRKIKLKHEDLEEHLKEQIDFLNTSCILYDDGKYSEAKRIATIIRVLFHDTRNSKSLLGQLGLKSDSFYSSSLPLNKKSLSTYSGLTMIGMKGKDTLYYPKLDEMSFCVNWLPFESWWEEVIIRDNIGNAISRSSLIKNSTNQDGGAHVDEALDEIYYNLAKNNSLETEIFDGKSSTPIPNPEKATIRQIGHEVLKTLLIDYEKKQTAKVNIWVGGTETVVGSKPSSTPKSKKIGRNEKCPCGSGEKYKRCHGK
ncbi:SEC-C metal-binding domain-containing protein [Polaribacter sp. IC063]|uniref:SEC-C metal-binding domain-containing protein n=1 Tax=Polaribacter sp. IC063 TaxID=57031 RepID=UPI0011BF2043|nr:SEC-C metal-binding domain-containing protein [Polaribacter sp. IC063]TXD50455.1 hypothetical protein ES043_16015 [Polaribacter sp. IC063]